MLEASGGSKLNLNGQRNIAKQPIQKTVVGTTYVLIYTSLVGKEGTYVNIQF